MRERRGEGEGRGRRGEGMGDAGYRNYYKKSHRPLRSEDRAGARAEHAARRQKGKDVIKKKERET